jgi:hypothetical protein
VANENLDISPSITAISSIGISNEATMSAIKKIGGVQGSQVGRSVDLTLDIMRYSEKITPWKSGDE